MTLKSLEKYLSYYGGINDWHLQTFLKINNIFLPKKVLYAGSWIHITPSLAFSHVVYVDLFSKMDQFFTDKDVLNYIKQNSFYKTRTSLDYYQSDYKKDFLKEKSSFDLLISLSSGFVSQACSKYLKKGGLLLANDEHFDSSMAYVDLTFECIGVFKNPKSLLTSKKEIKSHFITKKGTPITQEMVLENSKRSPSKARYKLKKKAPLYLFKKVS